MSKFIKLTNRVLDKNHITKIIIEIDKYYIHILDKNCNRFITKSEWYKTEYILHPKIYEVCKIKHPQDYKIITEWIN
jgi:hypothetical protein